MAKFTIFCVGVVIALTFAINASAVEVLTFEGLKDQEQILNFYDGGLGGSGSGPGPNLGITFGADSFALISGSGNFSGAPSMPTIAFFSSGLGDVMDVPAGFTTGFSFFYSAINDPGSVSVFDSLDGTGNLLASLNLPTTPSEPGTPGCPFGAFCPWFPIGVAFNGTAESVIFSGSANQIGFDNITLGSVTPVPEPSTLLLLGAGLAGVGLLRRRFKK